MSKSNALENALLELIFKNTDFANVGDATGIQGSTVPGSLYVSLHTADPTEAGTQTSSEATYGSYARVAVARDGAAWTVVANQAENTGAVAFPEATSGSETITHFGIGTASSGAGILLYSGALSASRAVSSGRPPSFAAGALTVTED